MLADARKLVRRACPVNLGRDAVGDDLGLRVCEHTRLRQHQRHIRLPTPRDGNRRRIARRTMRVVKMNLAFTAIYNVVGLTLAAFGVLPPIFAAAAQSLPDLGILANSARLLRQADSKS